MSEESMGAVSEASESVETTTESPSEVETTEQVSEGGSEETSQESGATPSDASKEEKPKKRKIKVKDEEIDEEEVARGYLHAREANKRFQEAAAERKAAEKAKEEAKKLAEERFEKLKSDPFSVLAELGLNPRELSEEYLIRQLEKEMMSPEQKEKLDLEEKLKSYEQKEAERKAEEEARAEQAKKEQEQQEITSLRKKYAEEYQGSFINALDKAGLPKNPTTVRRVAEVVLNSLSQGEEIPVEHAIRIVEQDYRSGLSEFLKELDADTLAKFLGDEAVDKLRQRNVAKVKNPTPKKEQVEEKPKSAPKERQFMDPYEWQQELKRKHGLI